MTAVAVTGASPITFVSEDSGLQIQIPLALLTVANGVVDASTWTSLVTLSSNDTTILTNLLADLLARGVIAPVTA
ncbi:MAG TPA: hypothetical protein VGM25_10195 [Caulobacteraceae bacterium]|jgi:hypothetical protein